MLFIQCRLLFYAVILAVTPERLQRIKQTLHLRQPDLTILCDEVHKERNLSAIVRSCDAFAVPKVHNVWLDEKYRLFGNQTAGSGNWVEVVTHQSIEGAIDHLKQQGLRVCAAHLSDSAKDYREYNFTQPTALLMGSELDGISEKAAELADEHLIIPMYGMVESFNVSVAASMLLSEAIRQRKAAGMLEHRRLDDDTYNRLFFEWCQPQITKFCQQRNIPYPEIGDDGELVDPQGFSALVNSKRRA